MQLTKAEYAKLVKDMQQPSPMGGNLLKAFLVGGLICALGEALRQAGLQLLALDEETAGCMTSMLLIALAALATGLGCYDDLARFAGAGTLVPITGFSNAMTAPAIEFKTEGFILGTAVKMFTIAGPVIVFGTVGSMIYGLLYYLWQVLL